MTKTEASKSAAIKSAILRAASRNRNITATGLRDEMQRGEISGWLYLPAVRAGNFADWTRGMCDAADTLAATGSAQ